MIIARTITTTATAQSVFDLLGHSNPHSNGILLQHVSGTVNYGSPNGTPLSLAANETIQLPSTNTKSVFVSGGGNLTVALF